MNITQIEENIKQLTTDFQAGKVAKEQFVYDFLLAYGHRKSSVSRVKSGERNLSKVAGEVRWKRHVYFKYVEGDNLHLEADKLKNDKVVVRDRIRFVIVTDFNKFLAIDIKTGDSLDIKLDEIVKHFDFFLPWAGMEKAVYQGENPADIKAAEKMAELFDIIKADNFNETNKNDTEALHDLNVFLTRLLFCFFAEDTEIFTRNLFSHALESHTNTDGSDVSNYLNRLFNVLNTSDEHRGELPAYLAKFPFVNGGLFAKELPAPIFSTKSRRMLIECGKELDWSDINPDIFGSMIQAVVHPDQRGGMGMHYTSVTNIMKVIEPLFLDDLYAELENIQFNIDEKLVPSRLRKLKDRLSKIKIFDPACGSGNFLIIAFKELRKLEMDVIKLLLEIEEDKHHNQDDLFAEVGLDSSFSKIKLSQFYGIELDDFAHEVAILSLWLAEHQMNVEFKAEFGNCAPTLPLHNGGKIIQGSATLLKWDSVCKKEEKSEVFIIGNPPYLGFKNQDVTQKSDLKAILGHVEGYKNLDYIACWFLLASQFLRKQDKAAFVTTNSICQGSQVELLWPSISEEDVEIDFAVLPFTWSNNAKNKAGVTCSIIGLRKLSHADKYLFNHLHKLKVNNINPYLADAKNIIVVKRRKALSNVPLITDGSGALDGGNLILSNEEKNELIQESPESAKFVRRYIGSSEFIKGQLRWCLWIEDSELKDVMKLTVIKQKIDSVKYFRENAGTRAKTAVGRPHKFAWINKPEKSQIIIPTVSSERRNYIPIGFLDSNVVVSNSASVVHNPEPYVFSILSSRIHMAWVKAVAGRLRSDIRYTSAICYNTFPIPDIQEGMLEILTKSAINILGIREQFSSKTMAELYDPNKMPQELKKAHETNDLIVDKLYSEHKFESDISRLEVLFELYETMTGGQNA